MGRLSFYPHFSDAGAQRSSRQAQRLSWRGDSAQRHAQARAPPKPVFTNPLDEVGRVQGGTAVDSPTLQREGVWELVLGGCRVGGDSGPASLPSLWRGAADSPRPQGGRRKPRGAGRLGIIFAEPNSGNLSRVGEEGIGGPGRGIFLLSCPMTPWLLPTCPIYPTVRVAPPLSPGCLSHH